jgi:hypothetical protein
MRGCITCTMEYNVNKKISFRKKWVNKTMQSFLLGDEQIELVDKYKYLGVYFDEYLDFKTTSITLAGAAGRALAGVI